VAHDDDRVAGYACSGAFRNRATYQRTSETSVYLAPDTIRRGAGTSLYTEMLWLPRQDEIHLVVAVVSRPNPASKAFHASLGFTEVGTLDEIGCKFVAAVSTTSFQLLLR